MAKSKTPFRGFHSDPSWKERERTWEECGEHQRAYRRKAIVKFHGEAGAVTGITKTFKQWQASTALVMERVNFALLARRIEALEAEVKTLKQALSSPKSIIVPVETFEPYQFDLVRPFQVVVESIDGEFEANFYDANIGASGDTETDAIENLKDIMVSLFEHYSKVDEKNLGAGPARQWAILKGLLRKRV